MQSWGVELSLCKLFKEKVGTQIGGDDYSVIMWQEERCLGSIQASKKIHGDYFRGCHTEWGHDMLGR